LQKKKKKEEEMVAVVVAAVVVAVRVGLLSLQVQTKGRVQPPVRLPACTSWLLNMV